MRKIVSSCNGRLRSTSIRPSALRCATWPLRSTKVSAHGSLPVSRYFCCTNRSMCCRRGPDRPADSGRSIEISWEGFLSDARGALRLAHENVHQERAEHAHSDVPVEPRLAPDRLEPQSDERCAAPEQGDGHGVGQAD